MSPRRRSAFTARLVRTPGDPGQPRVLDDLRQAIVAGDQTPGTLIPIDEVARFFDVSHIPVREALKMLTAEGLVEHVPRGGYSVAKLTFAEFRELYEVRQALEQAALRAAVPRATDADDAEIERTHEATLATTDDPREYHSLSRRFHLALIAPSGMQRLIHIYASAWNMTESARPMALVSDHERSQMCLEHGRLLAAFLARDTERLLTASADHFEHLKRAIEVFADDPDAFSPC